jgi:hypothetical protein
VELLDAVGYDAVDMGKLGEGWRSEPGTPLFVLPYSPAIPDGLDLQGAMQFVHSSAGMPASTERIASLVPAATRGPAGVIKN